MRATGHVCRRAAAPRAARGAAAGNVKMGRNVRQPLGEVREANERTTSLYLSFHTDSTYKAPLYVSNNKV